MIPRALSTIGLWLLLVGVLVLVGPASAVWMLAGIGLLTQHELYRLLERLGHKPFRKLGLVLGAAMILGPYYLREWTGSHSAFDIESAVIATILVACCARILWEREPPARVEALSSTLFGLMFVPFMFTFFVRLFWLYGDGPAAAWQGVMAGLWIIAVAKCCDAGAFLVGSRLGRTPLAPRTSPRKTWEGAVGGVVIAMAVSAGLVAAFPTHYPAVMSWWAAALLAIPVAVTAILSDLVESILKRAAAVKDSGHSIPGIGGAFDLTDSLLLPAPVGYVIFLVLAW